MVRFLIKIFCFFSENHEDFAVRSDLGLDWHVYQHHWGKARKRLSKFQEEQTLFKPIQECFVKEYLQFKGAKNEVVTMSVWTNLSLREKAYIPVSISSFFLN